MAASIRARQIGKEIANFFAFLSVDRSSWIYNILNYYLGILLANVMANSGFFGG